MEPKDVNPKNFKTKDILYNNSGFSIAYGIWEEKDEVIAMRWNGNNDTDSGYPKVFGNPMWFILPKELITSTLKSLLGKENSNTDEILNLLNKTK